MPELETYFVTTWITCTNILETRSYVCKLLFADLVLMVNTTFRPCHGPNKTAVWAATPREAGWIQPGTAPKKPERAKTLFNHCGFQRFEPVSNSSLTRMEGFVKSWNRTGIGKGTKIKHKEKGTVIRQWKRHSSHDFLLTPVPAAKKHPDINPATRYSLDCDIWQLFDIFSAGFLEERHVFWHFQLHAIWTYILTCFSVYILMCAYDCICKADFRHLATYIPHHVPSCSKLLFADF